MTWEIVGHVISDVGCVRTTNEDCGRIVRPADETEQARRGVLAIVADGMGGHSSGEIASRLAVDTVHRAYYEGDGAPDQAVRLALEEANRAIFQAASAESNLVGMGTTCVALAVCGEHAYAASVGDSRIYMIREGGIYQMTADDSAVGALVSRGVLTRAEARRHADRNVILRALGTHAEVAVSSWDRPLPVRAGDAFLLCTDGLTDLVDDAELLGQVAERHEVDACRALVELARMRGGYDNITVALLQLAATRTQQASAPITRELRVVP